MARHPKQSKAAGQIASPILLRVIIIAIIAGGYIVMALLLNLPPFERHVSEPALESVAPRVSQIKATDWQTYQSDLYGFKMQIPQGWIAREKPDTKQIAFLSPEYAKAFAENTANCSKPEPVDCNPEQPDFLFEFQLNPDLTDKADDSTDTYGNNSWTSYTVPDLYGNQRVRTAYNGDIYSFEAFDVAILQQMLETFAFTK